jgi:hypothetical protein
METDGERWARDAEILRELGQALDAASPLSVEVRLPRQFVEAALAAWEADDANDTDTAGETPEAKRTRHRAATLALIGLELAEQDVGQGDLPTVRLQAHLVGDALKAAWGDD